MFQKLKNWWTKRRCHTCNELKPKIDVSGTPPVCDTCWELDFERRLAQANQFSELKKQKAEQARIDEREAQKALIKEAMEEWYVDRLAREETERKRDTSFG